MNLYTIAVWAASIIGVGINLGLCVYNFRLCRRWGRLNRMWLEICVMAWEMRYRPELRRLLRVHAEPTEGELRRRWWKP